MIKFFLLLFFPLVIGFSPVEDSGEKSLPLKIAPSFSGNYGELRGGRFHAGVDFRVGGVVGEPVYSIDDGYICRVSVAPSGYGNGIYIRHHDGTMSVYGHLHRFRDDIAEMVKEAQYAKESFSVTLEFSENELPVSRGEYIGNVGNSGSSAAPHLHLEVRSKDGKGPINMIAEGYFKHDDKTPPIISRINFYSIYADTVGVVHTEPIGSFGKKYNKVIEVPEASYVAVDAIDKQYGTPAKLGIEVYEVFLDGESVYRYKVGNYTYFEQNTFNSLIEYGERVRSGRNMIKSYVEPGNAFDIESVNRGVILLGDEKVHNLRVVVEDLDGNKDVARYRIRKKRESESDSILVSKANHLYSTPLLWFLPFAYTNDGLSLSLPPKAFYSNQLFTVDSVSRGDICTYSKIWDIHTPFVPLNKAGIIELRVENLPDDLQPKAFIAHLTPGGDYVYCGGKYEDGAVRGRLSSFGRFTVGVDTIPPVIKPRFSSPDRIARSGQAAFTIKDSLSGIRRYRAQIDGKWILAQFDAKYDKLWIVLDPEVVSRGGVHELILEVTDNKNNISTYKTKFRW